MSNEKIVEFFNFFQQIALLRDGMIKTTRIW